MKNNRILLLAASLTVLATSAIAIAQSEGPRWTEQRMTRRVIAGIQAHLNARALEGRHALVILDIMLPDGDGRQVLRRLRSASEIPVIMLTARGDDAD